MSLNEKNEKCAIFSKNDITHLLIKGIGQFPNYIEKLICIKCYEWFDSLSPYEWDERDIVDIYKLQKINVNEANDYNRHQ